MTPPHGLPILFRQAVRIRSHNCARLNGKVTRGAHQHHGFHAAGLARREMQQDISTAANAESLESADTQVIEQRKMSVAAS